MTKSIIIKNLLNKFENNQYLVIREILFNYKKYDYDDKEECYNNIIFILEDFYNFIIDDTILNDYLRITNENELNRMLQNNFHNNLLKKYKKCIITGHDIEECEACHIIPLEIKFSYDITNGLLLSSSLHKLFDKFMWSINPNTQCIEIKQTSSIYLIHNYNNKYINLDTETLKNISWHYEKFIS